MATTYEKADSKMLTDVLVKHHSPLVAAGVTFDIVFARRYAGEEGELVPAVKAHGTNAAAKVQITSLQDRARGIADVKMTLDYYSWDRANEQTRKAILDHELTHITLKDEGEEDDLGRPKLKMRRHDWVTWGFAEIAERWKDAAPEVQSFRQIADEYGQLLLFGGSPTSKLHDAVRKVLKPGKGIDKVTVTTNIPGSEPVTITSDDLDAFKGGGK